MWRCSILKGTTMNKGNINVKIERQAINIQKSVRSLDNDSLSHKASAWVYFSVLEAACVLCVWWLWAI